MGLSHEESVSLNLTKAIALRYRVHRLATVELPIHTIDQRNHAKVWYWPYFSQALDDLTPDSNNETFRYFFDAFGTHILVKVELGGFISEYTEVESCQLSRSENNELYANKEQTASSLAKLDSEVKKFESYSSQQSEVVINHDGGDVSVFTETKSADKYISTVPTAGHPAIIDEGNIFIPIYDILEEGHPMKGPLKVATNAYILQGRSAVTVVSTPCKTRHQLATTSEIAIIAGAAGGGLVFLVVLCCVCRYCCGNDNTDNDDRTYRRSSSKVNLVTFSKEKW